MEQRRRAQPPRVALFVTCMVDVLYPGVARAAAHLLERAGAVVSVPPDQGCCGQPAFNAGYRDEARRLALRFLDRFAPPVERGEVDAVVAPGGSCVAMVKRHFPRLLEDDPAARERALSVAALTHELSEYLVDGLGFDGAPSRFHGRIAFHPSCHLLRELGISAAPLTLLARIPGAELVELPEAGECCGFGGLFAVGNAPISAAIGAHKVANAEASGADVLAVCDVSCMTHLNGLFERRGSHCRAVHLAELLAGTAPQPPARPAGGAETTPAAPELHRAR